MATKAGGHALEWTSGETRVVVELIPLEVLGALMRLRTRVLQRIDALAARDAEHPSRCAEWRAVDVVNHLADTTGWAAAVTAAAAHGAPTTVFEGFHVRRTPKQLTDAGPRDLDAARARLHTAMAESLGQVAEVVAVRDKLTDTPLGPQPFPVAACHVLWDTWLHERDLCLPLGIEPPQHEDEIRLSAIYTLRLVGLCVAMARRELSATLRLHGATEVTLRLDASAALTAVRVVDDAAPQLSGDAATVIDALSGRGDIDAAVEGPAELRTAFRPLCALLAGD
jgi:Mycothiol maleylpyruvate isomerase N-terminal domain